MQFLILAYFNKIDLLLECKVTSPFYLKVQSQVSDNLVTESSLKMTKNAFFHLKSFFCSQGIKVFALTFFHVSTRLDLKDKVSFKLYDVTAWLTNNCNTYIAQYLEN